MNVILNTEIGYDIGSTWALNLMLSQNLFDVKLISIANGDIDYQVKLVAKILKLLKKEHIPIVFSKNDTINTNNQPQKRWIEDFDLEQYAGKIYNSYQEAYEEVLIANDNITVVELSSFTTLLPVVPILKKHNTKIVAVFDSLIDVFEKISSSNLKITLLPRNVFEDLIITGENYRNIRNLLTTRTKIICENYDIWQEDYIGDIKKFDISSSSTILYDLAPALFLLFPQNFDVVEKTVGKNTLNVVLNVHKLDAMIKFLSEQYSTSFSYNNEIKRLEIDGMYSLTYSLKKSNVMLSVVEYGWEAHGPGSSYGPAVRDYYILHFITKGKGKLVVDDKEFIVKKGDCFLIPPKLTTYYEANKENPYTYYWVGFDGLEAKDLLEKSGFITNGNYVIHPEKYNAVFEKFANFEITTTDDYVVQYQLLGKLYMLFSEIMSKENVDTKEKSNYVDLAIKYMNLNYSKNISIELLSKVIGVERTYFYRIFKEATKMGPKEYLSSLRIEKAKMLLCNTHMSIKEVALQVGFSNYLSFVRTFSEKNGISPTLYRKKNR